jgi:hypothetical protein
MYKRLSVTQRLRIRHPIRAYDRPIQLHKESPFAPLNPGDFQARNLGDYLRKTGPQDALLVVGFDEIMGLESYDVDEVLFALDNACQRLEVYIEAGKRVVVEEPICSRNYEASKRFILTFFDRLTQGKTAVSEFLDGSPHDESWMAEMAFGKPAERKVDAIKSAFHRCFSRLEALDSSAMFWPMHPQGKGYRLYDENLNGVKYLEIIGSHADACELNAAFELGRTVISNNLGKMAEEILTDVTAEVKPSVLFRNDRIAFINPYASRVGESLGDRASNTQRAMAFTSPFYVHQKSSGGKEEGKAIKPKILSSAAEID